MFCHGAHVEVWEQLYFFPPMWVPGIELRLLDLAAGVLPAELLAGPRCMFPTGSECVSVTIRGWLLFEIIFLWTLHSITFNMAFVGHWESGLCVPWVMVTFEASGSDLCLFKILGDIHWHCLNTSPTRLKVLVWKFTLRFLRPHPEFLPARLC